MPEKWYDDLPDDFFQNNRDVDAVYEKAFAKIREGLDQGLGFDPATEKIDVQDEMLRKQIIDDMLKVLLAEQHFAKHVPLDQLARQLKVSQERLESTKSSMLDEVGGPKVKNYFRKPDSDGEFENL